MPDTSYHKLTYYERADAPLLGTQLQELATDAETGFIHVQAFASAGARNTAIPTPETGRLVWREDTKELEYYDGSAWTPLSPLGNSTSTTSTYGVVNDPDGGMIVIGGVDGFTNTDANGRVTITFPEGGFPNACSTVLVSNGDGSGLGSSNYRCQVHSWSRTQVVVQYTLGSAAAAAGISTLTNFIAFGW